MKARVTLAATVALVGAVGLGGALTAQAPAASAQAAPPPQTPARDATRPPTRGTASISGVVVSADESHQPLRHVQLSLLQIGVEGRQTATDDQGRFAFPELPAATYTLQASKGGYVTTNFGAKRPGGFGVPIPIKDGQRFVLPTIQLTRGAVISGRLVDAEGHAISSTFIQASSFQIVNGERQPINRGGGSTDSRGVYRIWGLEAGEYVLSVRGRFDPGEVRMNTAAEIQWAEQRASGAPGVAPVGPPQAVPFLTSATYYPGTADAGAAAIVTVAAGEERTGVDFAVLRVPASRIVGRVVGADGQPVAGAVVVRSPKRDSPLLFDLGGTTRSSADGTFAYVAVAPGDYSINARTVPPAGRGAPSPGGAPLALMWGAADVSVNGADVPDVTVRLQPGVTVSGSAVFEGETPIPDMGRFQPRLASATPRALTVEVTTGTGANAFAPDRTFKIDGVIPGLYRFNVFVPSAGTPSWSVKSVVRDGKDLLDTPFEIRPGEDLSNVVMTFTDKHTELGGVLQDQTGQPAPQFVVVAFPTNRSQWEPPSRFVRSARTALDGSFKFTGLPPGEYYVCALTELANQQKLDAAFLEPLVPASFKVTLAEGEKKTQNFKMGGS
jgi:hypothetical protein